MYHITGVLFTLCFKLLKRHNQFYVRTALQCLFTSFFLITHEKRRQLKYGTYVRRRRGWLVQENELIDTEKFSKSHKKYNEGQYVNVMERFVC